MSQSLPVISSADSSDQGSFLTGFTVGLFAGAAGYFLFGTDRGQQLRRQVSAEWVKAQRELQTELSASSSGAGEPLTVPSLRDVIKHVVAQMVPVSSKSQPKTKRGAVASKEAKFKGV